MPSARRRTAWQRPSSVQPARICALRVSRRQISVDHVVPSRTVRGSLTRRDGPSLSGLGRGVSLGNATKG